MDELPENIAVELGRITYFAGHADYYLGLLVPAHESEPVSKGLSGNTLAKKLAPHAAVHSELQEILDAYGPMYDRRNVLVHGAHNYSDTALSTWYIPLRGKGVTARSFIHTVEQLRYMADSWQRLSEAAHGLVHANRNDGGTTP